jgi:nucleoside-diphosphate-sugar epimerase
MRIYVTGATGFVGSNFVHVFADRHRAWSAYVEATRHVVDAANTVGAHVVLISSDWVFDGTLGPADEYEPPDPINAYGFSRRAPSWLSPNGPIVERSRGSRESRECTGRGRGHRARRTSDSATWSRRSRTR